jgi:hypothetical protein
MSRAPKMTTRHVVREGECLAQIASRHGFADAGPILADPANQALFARPGDRAEVASARPNPNVLRPGDQIVVPAPQLKQVEVATGRQHRCKVKLPRKQLRVVLRDHDGEPLANTEYLLRVRDEERVGTTDGQGLLRERIPAGVPEVELELLGRVLTLRLGRLEPLASASEPGLAAGVQARLRNLGYDPGPSDGKIGRRTRAALASFQADHQLSITAKPDEPTLAKLEELHGC